MYIRGPAEVLLSVAVLLHHTGGWSSGPVGVSKRTTNRTVGKTHRTDTKKISHIPLITFYLLFTWKILSHCTDPAQWPNALCLPCPYCIQCSILFLDCTEGRGSTVLHVPVSGCEIILISSVQTFKKYGRHHTKFSDHSNLLPSICVPLMVMVVVVMMMMMMMIMMMMMATM